jgi:hypothetical protein
MGAMDLFFEPSLHMQQHELVNQFFTIFSVFEYALIGSGYAKSSNWDGATPNWNRFVVDIENEFDWQFDPELTSAVQYLLNHPPRRQVVRGEYLGWEESQRSPEMSIQNGCCAWLKPCATIYSTGAKYHYNPERDARLIQSSLLVLRAWARLKPEIHWIVENAYEALPNR